jgi:hypothetical protein
MLPLKNPPSKMEESDFIYFSYFILFLFSIRRKKTDLWVERFEDAKFYIEQDIAYIPAWWKQKYRTEYKRLRENEYTLH